jgi:hypothetical protein
MKLFSEIINEYNVTLVHQADDGIAFHWIFQNRKWTVIVSNGSDWEHVSISSKNRTPNWETMNSLKDLIWNNDETVMQLHPKKNDYVNNHEHCLHLWKPLNEVIPVPPSVLV